MFRKKDIEIYEDEQIEEEIYESDDEIEEEVDGDEFVEDESEDEEFEASESEEAFQDDSQEVESEEESEEAAGEEEIEEDEIVDEKSFRRVARRKRRIRNQIIAYIVMLVVLAGLVVGGIYAGKKLIRYVNDNKKTETPVEDELVQQEPIEITSPDTTPEPETVIEVNPVDEVARYYISQMTLEEKVAGLFFVTPESMMEGVNQAVIAGGKTEEALNAYAVGGIIYFSKNIQSADQITEMLTKTQQMSKYPIFLGVDEEGGSVARVADSISDIANIGDVSELGALNDPGAAYSAYSEVADYLEELGFNVNFAPVADIYDGNNALFAERSFGTDANVVANYVYQAVCGIQDGGISACVKHFPGHGSADADSHNGRATVELTEEELMTSEILPFQMAITANPDFVMIGQVSLPNVLGDYTPATMSSDIVTRILREQLGYSGIIITDAMNMTAVTEYYTSAEAAVNAINAGCDMILMPENFKEAYQGVLDAVNNGEISVERIEESLMRIYRVKCAGMTMDGFTGEAPVEAGSIEEVTDENADVSAE